MKTIVLISCASRKRTHKAKAGEMYVSRLFGLSLDYAKSLNADEIFILSAKYGLLHLDDEIEPYDITLKQMPRAVVRDWADKVIEQLASVTDLQRDHVIFLAGNNYRKYLIGIDGLLRFSLTMVRSSNQ